jgi:predicted transcriptional regulator
MGRSEDMTAAFRVIWVSQTMFLRHKLFGLPSLFGSLELRVLDALWSREGEATVRDVLQDFPNAAYTTVMTTMERLHRKGVLVRRKDGRAFLYRVAQSREELESTLVARAIQPLLDTGSAQPILSSLVDEVSRHDERLLDELERLVRAKRRQKE